jgi:2-enoate reductase
LTVAAKSLIFIINPYSHIPRARFQEVEMQPAFSKLFEPVSIGHVMLKNRIAMAPMGIVGLTESDGNPNQRAIDYYIERARGGVGLIITSVFKVEGEIEKNVHATHMINSASTGPFGEICEAVHALGSKIFVQLTAGFGRVAPSRILVSHPVSASAVPNYHNPDIICRPLEIAEIEQLVRSFGQAAAILADCGVDGVELHGHEGYLLDQFTTSIWNQRSDKYGGDPQKRLTFPIEVLQEIKKRAGADFPVQYRFGLKHYIKGLRSGALDGEEFVEAGRDVREGIEMAKLLEKAGFDSLHVDAGCYDSWYWAHPPGYQAHGCMVDMAAEAKKVVKIPVVAVGRLDLPEMAERVVAGGKADIVAIGRGLLADPAWPAKAAAGKAEEIRPCIGCHDGCIGRFFRGKPLSCTVNPACGRERLYRLARTDSIKKVVIAGGGIAGMEAARVAALRGHRVILFEKGQQLGGHLIEASVPSFKKDLLRLMEWHKKQIEELGVEVKLGIEASAELISGERPDITLIASGSVPLIPAIPGVDMKCVVTCIDLLRGTRVCGKSALVIGGGLVGCETALWLAQEGKQVTLVEMLPSLMNGGLVVPGMNKVMLLDLLAFHHVDVLTGTRVESIQDSGACVSHDGRAMSLKADTIVLAAGLKAENRLYRSLNGKTLNLYAIGDCAEPRNVLGAIWDGYEAGRAF